MQDKKRIDQAIKYGILDTVIVTAVLTFLFELLAGPLSSLFGLTGDATKEIIVTCERALRIASIGYVFMGFSVAVQGVLQSIRYAFRPLLIALFRLVIFVFPVAFFFTSFDNVTEIVWWTFPIAEVLTAVISAFILKNSYKNNIKPLEKTRSDQEGSAKEPLVETV